MYAIVPAVDGMPQIGQRHLHSGISISGTEAVVWCNGEPEEGWRVLTEEEYREEVKRITGAYPVEPETAPEPETVEQKLSRLEAQNLILMEALATVYAETLGDKADDQTLTDLYTPLVEAGRKTVQQVPEKIRSAVQGRLSAKGDGGVKDAN